MWSLQWSSCGFNFGGFSRRDCADDRILDFAAFGFFWFCSSFQIDAGL